MNIEYTGKTDVGRKRDHNEDNFATDEGLGLYIVCDGMGGHAAGEVASEIAVETVRDVIGQNREVIEAFEKHDTAEGRTQIAALIVRAVETACGRVYAEAQADPAKAGMGTTLEMVLVANHMGFMGHVGDSRLYMKRGDEVYQLSEDHSFVREMVRMGKMTEEEAHHSPVGNVITRAVGIQETVRVDTLAFDILPGDTLLLCSDGLSDYVENDAELAALLEDDGLDASATRLISMANERGGKDNITAILLRGLPSAGKTEHDTGRARDVHLKINTLKKVRLFKHLTYKELMLLLNLTDVQVHEPGVTLVEEGGGDTDFYVVLQGRMEVTRAGTKLAELGQGEHFGEMEMVSKRGRSASVTTVSKTAMLVIRRVDFMDLLKANEHLAVKLLWSITQTLSGRLHDANQRITPAR